MLPETFGFVFTMAGKEYRVEGIDPGSRSKPLLLTRVADGKAMVSGLLPSVIRHINEAYRASVTPPVVRRGVLV